MKILPELHGDLFSESLRHACPLEGAVFYMAVDETIVNVINEAKRRASPCSNYNDQYLSPRGQSVQRGIQ